MPKSRLSAFLYLLVVFLSGAILGGFAYRLYMVKTVLTANAPRPKPNPEEVRRRIVADMTAKIHLDQQQVVELNRLMDNTRDAWRQMRDQMNAQGRNLHDQQWEKVKALLRPEQKQLYDQWQAERDAERKRRDQEHPDKK